MSNDHLIHATPLSRHRVVQHDGAAIHAAWPQAREKLRAAVGPEAVRLFARPAPDGQGSVAWHGWADGSAVPVDALPGDEAALVRRKFEGLLERLQEAAREDDWLRGFLDGALCVLSRDALRGLEGSPVLVDWGLADGDGPANPQRSRKTTLGDFASLALLTFSYEPVETKPYDGAAAVATGAATAAAIGVGGDGVRREHRNRDWLPLAVLLLLLLLVLIYLLWPGNLIYPDFVSGSGASR